jgi:hypothetical protein
MIWQERNVSDVPITNAIHMEHIQDEATALRRPEFRVITY